MPGIVTTPTGALAVVYLRTSTDSLYKCVHAKTESSTAGLGDCESATLGQHGGHYLGALVMTFIFSDHDHEDVIERMFTPVRAKG